MTNMSSKPTDQSSPEFISYYLQRATHELSEDLDKVRNAEDFKADSIPFLVHALKQGVELFSPEDQKRATAEPKGKEEDA
jgi:ribosome assembly protein 3